MARFTYANISVNSHTNFKTLFDTLPKQVFIKLYFDICPDLETLTYLAGNKCLLSQLHLLQFNAGLPIDIEALILLSNLPLKAESPIISSRLDNNILSKIELHPNHIGIAITDNEPSAAHQITTEQLRAFLNLFCNVFQKHEPLDFNDLFAKLTKIGINLTSAQHILRRLYFRAESELIKHHIAHHASDSKNHMLPKECIIFPNQTLADLEKISQTQKCILILKLIYASMPLEGKVSFPLLNPNELQFMSRHFSWIEHQRLIYRQRSSEQTTCGYIFLLAALVALSLAWTYILPNYSKGYTLSAMSQAVSLGAIIMLILFSYSDAYDASASALNYLHHERESLEANPSIATLKNASLATHPHSLFNKTPSEILAIPNLQTAHTSFHVQKP